MAAQCATSDLASQWPRSCYIADAASDSDGAVEGAEKKESDTSIVTLEELWRRDVGNARRATVWKLVLLEGISLQAKTPQEEYERLCESTSSYDSAIRRDVHRTLPQEELFRERNGKGQQALFRLLRALSIRHPDVGYCQSMNFIVATLITIYPDDEAAAFHCALALLLRNSLLDFFKPTFPKLGVVIWQFDRVVEGFLPRVHAQLQRYGVNAEYYAIQWFLTLFASDLDQAIVRRVWDRFLVVGWQVIVQVGLALLYTIQDTLPTLDSCHALSFLRKFVRSNTYAAEDLLDLAASFEVTHQMLSAVEAAYEWDGGGGEAADVQLLVVRDLNSGESHWAVQTVPRKRRSTKCEDAREGDDDLSDEQVPVPRAFNRKPRPSISDAFVEQGDGPRKAKGSVLPFLIRDLDSGETTVMDQAWSQYTDEMKARADASAGPVSLMPLASLPNERRRSCSD